MRCGASFGCGAGADGCWCTALPAIDPAKLAAMPDEVRAELGLPPGAPPASCLCPACLAAIAHALNALNVLNTLDALAADPAQAAGPAPIARS